MADIKPSEFFTIKTNRTCLYNIQPIDNIPSVMKRGILSFERARSVIHKSVAMQEVQTRRNGIRIPGGLSLHQYANLYFDPRNPMLYRRKSENENLCILKIDRTILDVEGVVVSDMNAASSYASFYPPDKGLLVIDFELVYAKYWTNNDGYADRNKKLIKCAEVLVPYKVPVKYIVGVIVINEDVKSKLEEIGFTGDIVVGPDYFF